MSLFAGLFAPAGDAAPSALFAQTSKFKRTDDGTKKNTKKDVAGKRKRSTKDAAPPPAAAAAAEVAADAPAAKKVKAKARADKPAAQPAAAPAQRARKPAAAAAPSPAEAVKPAKVKAKKPPATIAAAVAAAAEPEAAAPAPAAAEKRPLDAAKKRAAAAAKAAAEAQKLQRTVFVGNLPAGAKRKALARLFSQYGAVESVRLRCVPLERDAKMPRRAAVASGRVDAARGSAHAYVVFEEESAAEASLALNMGEFEGHHLRVDAAGVNQLKVKAARKGAVDGGAAAAALRAQAPPVRYDPGRSVFVGNLHVETEDEELIRFFVSGVGAGADVELEAVRVVRDPKTSLGKGIAFALFKSKAGRRAALALDGRQLKGRPLRVTVVSQAGGSSGGGGGSSNGADWQGVSASASGRRRGPTGAPGAAAKKAEGKRKGTGKRPAVAERKAKAKAATRTGGSGGRPAKPRK